MLITPTIDMLRELGLYGMATAFQELDAQSEARGLEHGEWLAMLLEREATRRRQKRFEARARAAKLRHDAQIENADFGAARGLDRNLFMALDGCDWIRKHHSSCHRASRRRQKLACLRSWPQGLPRRLLRCLSPRSPAVRCPLAYKSGARRSLVGNYCKPTPADAISDRLVHNACRIYHTGESMRKQRPPTTPENIEA